MPFTPLDKTRTIADLYSREASLVVEVDGAEAHGSEEAQLYDRERDEYMAALGLRVLRVPAREVLHNLDGVYEAIQHACAERLDAAGAAWVPAVDLQVGDLVFVGPERRAVPLAEVRREQCEEEVWDLEVEGAHSFITQVCAVHNCGSGTTAYVAEQWGRRWITIDTSRVAVALARQRLLTAKYDYYTLADEAQGVAGGFVYRTVPHIMLSTISQCTALDPIFHRWEPVLAERLAALNGALAGVDEATRTRLQAKLAEKERREGKRAVTEADQRRWLLPREGWQEWEAPYDADPDWPEGLRAALEAYRQAWREKMDEVNATIAVSAPQEALYDQPEVTPGVLRVSGPFTVEGVQPVEMGLEESPIGGAPEEMGTFAPEAEPANAEAYLQRMIRLLRQDGVRFPNNVVQTFERLEAVSGGLLHAEGEWGANGDTRRVAVSVGPQYGPVTAKQVEECLREAYRRGYDDLVFAGFAFDGAAQAIIQEDANPKVRCHLAHIRPDVNMGDLLKDTAGSQLFTVFGLPRVALKRAKGGEYVVEMQGVDVYDPVSNTIQATGASKVAAWFLDQDYDGRCFCISQAFFPDESAWDKLARALRSVVDPARFAAFSGTRSLPFGAGTHKRIAVKVIDPRGNEVMRVMGLDGEGSYG
ncbi:MAG: DUF559 domain-containing protein [Chloroflexi bacterium]|nr:DUF559 domain-containing protein [Chloroflexota bacterium]